LDAYDYAGTDYTTVTRPAQGNESQQWVITEVDFISDQISYRIQQASTKRFLDAYDYEGTDFKVVTRDYQGNRSQVWLLQE
jgi:hypothetical protein